MPDALINALVAFVVCLSFAWALVFLWLACAYVALGSWRHEDWHDDELDGVDL